MTILCPKLFGLYDAVREGQFYLDGQKVEKPRLKQHEFYDVLILGAQNRPQTLGFERGGARVESAVNSVQQDSAPFLGKNVAVTLSRDNDLTWIEDFACYYRVEQGLQPFGTLITSSAWRHYDSGALSNCVMAPETQAAFANIEWAKTPAE